MTTAPAPLPRSRCRGRCAAAVRYPDHHNRLLDVDVDTDALLELIEVAVTWHELDYSEASIVGPAEWETFAQSHRWAVPARAERAFSLALDVVGRHGVGLALDPHLAEVVDLVRA